MFKASLDYKRERTCHQKKAKKQNRPPVKFEGSLESDRTVGKAVSRI